MECCKAAGTVAVPYWTFDREGDVFGKDFQELRKAGVKIYGVLPSIGTGYHDEKIQIWLDRFRDRAADVSADEAEGFQRDGREPFFPDGIYIGNQGQIEMVRDLSVELFGDDGLNVFNGYTLDFWYKMGFSGCTLSYELDEEDLKEFFDARTRVNLSEWEALENIAEVLVYGRIPVMTSEYCPVAGSLGIRKKHCGACSGKENFVLVSERGERYPVLTDERSCQSVLLSAEAVDRRAALKGLLSKVGSNVDVARRVCVWDESPEEILALIRSL